MLTLKKRFTLTGLFRTRVLQRMGGRAIASLTRWWMSTLESRGLYDGDPRMDPAHPEYHGPCLFLFWHEYIPYPLDLRCHCNIAMLLSRHHDAEWLSEATRYMGFRTIRGSTNRGGVAAIRQLMRSSEFSTLAITPDGPRGPRRRLAPGAVFVASKLEIPIVPLGFGYDRPWRLSTWDRFAIPRPFSRARCVVGLPIRVSANLRRDGLEHARQRVEAALNSVTERAEQWAESGHACPGEVRLTGDRKRWAA